MMVDALVIGPRDQPSTAVPGLTVGEERFCREYIKDGSHWAAAVRAGYTAVAGHVDFNYGLQHLAKPAVQAYLAHLRREHVREAVIEPAEILRMYWDIATADASELTAATRIACRYCYGVDFAYQWKGDWEYAEDLERAMAELEAWQRTSIGPAPRLPAYPSDGRWYDWKADPNEDCPRCEGRGVQHIEIVDTRRMSPKARRLFAGVKVTAAGWEVKTRDQDAALKAVAAAIGMITEGHGTSMPGTSRPITRDDLAKLAPEDLDRMIELSEKLAVGYSAPQAPASSAAGGEDEVARASQRIDGSADPARSGGTGPTDVA